MRQLADQFYAHVENVSLFHFSPPTPVGPTQPKGAQRPLYNIHPLLN